ncbi:MAG: flavodoxin family protein, partial [Firmicutes bacterium]|nr:flavodoxin family protein [Bacillota bacterium]
MSKNVLILSTSPRRGSNSEALAEAFASGARDGGNQVEMVSVRDMELRFCRGCFACQKTGKCIIKDDMQDVVPK